MRITLPNVWPFMKLPNGFGSHCSRYLVFKLASPVRYGIRLNYMYLYSPILFDSQDLNHNLSTRIFSQSWFRCRCNLLLYPSKACFCADARWRCSCHASSWAAGAAYQDPRCQRNARVLANGVYFSYQLRFPLHAPVPYLRTRNVGFLR